MSRTDTLPARFWSKVDKSGEHWLWTGYLDRGGYGWINVENTPQLAHRVSLKLAGIEVPDDMTVDHLCRTRACVRPDCLEVVDLLENIRRGPNWPGNRTHCPQGHPYDEANTYVTWQGWRLCRACHREHERKRNERLRQDASTIRANDFEVKDPEPEGATA